MKVKETNTRFLRRKKGNREGSTEKQAHKYDNLIVKSQKLNERLTLLQYVVKTNEEN